MVTPKYPECFLVAERQPSHVEPMNTEVDPRGRDLSLMVNRWLLLCLWWGLGLYGREARAETAAPEYAVKAAFVGKFPQFVKWPSGAGSSMTVGVLGDDPFGSALDGPFKIKRSKRVEDLKGCQIIFIAKSERGNIGAILSGLAGTNTLTVGESEGFAKQGGIIGFTFEGDKVRFEINTGAARRSGLTIDPRLLQLAVRVFNS
jgi:hypothetical protein